MLLNKLVDYADEHCDRRYPFHTDRDCHWQLDIRTRNGTLVDAVLTPLVDENHSNRGISHHVPTIVRTQGVEPVLAADDVQYVLGWSDETTSDTRVRKCHDAFVDLAVRWADSPQARDDVLAHVVGEFYRSGGPAMLERPDHVTAKQRVVLAVDGEPVCEAPSVVPFWTAEIIRRKGTGKQGLCLVCGATGALMRMVPGSVSSGLVPGAESQAALLSVNQRVYGYDLSEQLEHVPVCVDCCDAIPKALDDVLSSTHTFGRRGQDSRTAWWCVKPQLSAPIDDLEDPKPSTINELLASMWEEAGPEQAIQLDDEELGQFCSVTVGGNQGRIVVQDWVDIPLTRLRNNLGHWFCDQEIQPQWPDGAEYHGLSALARAFGRWEKRRGDYTEFYTRGADRPRYVTRQLLRCAVRKAPLAPSLRAHLVHRITTDGYVDDRRAALIRLALNRSIRDEETTRMPPGLDPTYADPAYLGGRLFAVLAQLQRAANTDSRAAKNPTDEEQQEDRSLNTTYSDRFFTGAARNPRAALVSGRLDAKAWFSKLRRGGHQGLASYFENQLTEIYRMLDPAGGLPTTNNLRQQEQFILGYHHQRAHNSSKNTTADS